MSSKILVIAPAWVGDLVMSQTLFKLLKHQKPDVVIDVLAADWALPILQRMPEVNKVHTLSIKHGELQLKQRFLMGKTLRQARYDQAILLPNSLKSALLPFWAHIPKRTGWVGELRFGLLNDVRHLDKQKLPLMIQRFAALGLPKDTTLPEVLPQPSLQVDPLQVQSTLEQMGLERESRPILAICPGAEYGPAKRWPTAHHAKVAEQKMAEGWAVWIMGSANDQAIAREIQAHLPEKVLDFTGRTHLGQAIDLLSLAHTVLSNDSGLMHISAALAKPLIVIYGSSDPRFTPPLTDKKQILSLQLPCSPCFQRVCPLEHMNCLKNLHPVTVLHAIEQLSL